MAKPPNLTAGAAGLHEPAAALDKGSRTRAPGKLDNHSINQRRAGDDRKRPVGCPGASSLITSSDLLRTQLSLARHVV